MSAKLVKATNHCLLVIGLALSPALPTGSPLANEFHSKVAISNNCTNQTVHTNSLLAALEDSSTAAKPINLDKAEKDQIDEALETMLSCKLMPTQVKTIMQYWNAEFMHERNYPSGLYLYYQFHHDGWEWVASPIVNGCNLGWFTCWFEGFVNSVERRFIFKFDAEDRLSSAVTMLTGF
ncbi:MAG: hypothetical protein ABJO57_14900 [Lentilitoribacter sp.]